MPLLAQQLSFDVTAAGAFTVPLASGWGNDAKLVLVWTDGNQGLSVTSNRTIRYGHGFGIAGGSSGSNNGYYLTNVNTTEARRRLSSTYILELITTAVQEELNFSGFGFEELQFNATQFTRAYTVHAMVLGGSELLNTAIRDVDIPLGTGTWDITGLGFQPNFGMTFTQFLGNKNVVNTMFGMEGYYGDSDQFSNNYFWQNAVSPSNNETNLWQTAMNQHNAFAGTLRAEVLFQQWLADGVRFNTTVNGNTGSTRDAVHLFVEFTNAPILGISTTPITPSDVTRTPGNTPKAVLYFSGGRSFDRSQAYEGEIYHGGSDGTTHRNLSMFGKHNVSTTECQVDTDIVSLSHFNTGTGAVAERCQTQFSGGDVIDDWVDVDSTARDYGHITFVETPSLPSIPAAGTSTSRVDTQGDIDVTWPSLPAAGTTTSRVDTQGDVDVTFPTIAAAGITTSRVDTQGDIDYTPPTLAASGATTSRVDTQGDIDYTPPALSAQGTTTSRVDTQGDINYTPPALLAAGTTTSRVDTQGDIDVTWPAVAAAGIAVSRVDTLGDVNVQPPVGAAVGRSTSRVDTIGDIYAPVVAAGVTTSRVDTLGDILAPVAAIGVTTSRVDTIGDIPTGDFAANPCRVIAVPGEDRSAEALDENRAATARTENRTVISEC